MNHRTNRLKPIAAALPAWLWSTLALAHEGHGLPDAHHWHASDAWGFVAFGAAVAAAAWFIRRK